MYSVFVVVAVDVGTAPNLCEPNPCKNGGKCKFLPEKNDYICEDCLGRFTGKDCSGKFHVSNWIYIYEIRNIHLAAITCAICCSWQLNKFPGIYHIGTQHRLQNFWSVCVF